MSSVTMLCGTTMERLTMLIAAVIVMWRVMITTAVIACWGWGGSVG